MTTDVVDFPRLIFLMPADKLKFKMSLIYKMEVLSMPHLRVICRTITVIIWKKRRKITYELRTYTALKLYCQRTLNSLD